MCALGLSFVAPYRVEWTDVDLPRLDEGAIRGRTLYSGVSAGTELLAYRGELPDDLPLDETIGSLRGTFSYPFRYGYSCVGIVEESRGGTEPGTLVFAFHPHQSEFVARAEDLVVLDEVDPRLATLFPLVETALQVSLDAGAVAHEVVVVTGLGGVGLLASLLLARSGAEVIASEPVEWKRGVGAGLGIRAVAPADLDDVVSDLTEGEGAPLVVEASGNPGALSHALRLLAHEGTALVASWYGTKQVTLPLGADFHRRRLTIRSTQVSTIPAHLSQRWTLARRRSEAASLLHELPLKLIATHEFAFRDAEVAYRALNEGREGLIHAALAYE